MKAINAAMKSYFSLFNRHFDKIKGRPIYEHYKFTLRYILSDFPAHWASHIPAKIHPQAKQHWTQNDFTQGITWSVFIHHMNQVAGRKK